MKKIIGIALALMLVALCFGSALAENKLEKILASGKIVMATSPDFAPMEFIDPTKSGQDAIVGSDIELAKYIAEKLGVGLVIETMEFSAVQAAVTQGKVDMGISGFAYTETRAEAMELSIFFNMDDDDGQGLLVLTEQADQYTTAEDFAGKKVAVQNASLQYNLLTSQLPDAIPELVSVIADGVMMLINGKVDAVGVSGTNGQGFADNYPSITLCDFYYDFESEGNVLAVTKGETELMDAINEILAEVNEAGLYKEWREAATALAKELGVSDEEE